MNNDISSLSFYSFFTQYSLLDDYGFRAGLSSRVFRKLLGKVPSQNTVEFELHQGKHYKELINSLDLDTITDSPILSDLNRAIYALCSKVIAFGLDVAIQEKLNILTIDSGVFLKFQKQLSELDSCSLTQLRQLSSSCAEIEEIIYSLRINRTTLGTSIHLTIVTKRILEYLDRAQDLFQLKEHIRSKEAWEFLFKKHLKYSREKNSLTHFVRRHTDLVALEVVDNTSQKGEKYIADNQNEYWEFLSKSFLGGAIIAVFAFLKLILEGQSFPLLSNALYFSLNYALCFVLVKQLGGIIATKQPAMTASTIARSIDNNNTFRFDSIAEVTQLIRRVFRSQFISLIGNFFMAIVIAALIGYIFHHVYPVFTQAIIDPNYLTQTVQPNITLIWYASIAGVFLAISGLLSGYVDNKMVTSKIGYRIRNRSRFIKSETLARLVEEKSGAFFGNVSLGFMLGTAFLFSYVLPIPFDIRHIAFSSANVGFAAVRYSFEDSSILTTLLGVACIGVTNFTVSFSITLFLALKSRGATLSIIPSLSLNILKDFIMNPIQYFYFYDRSNQVSSKI